MKNKKTLIAQHNVQRSQLTSNCSKGITLVALVVTIVVLLILAGITIIMLFGENGIIKKAQDAKEKTDIAQTSELEGIDTLVGQMNTILDGSGTDSAEVPEILLRYMLGEDYQGISVLNIADLNSSKFISNDVIPDAETSISFIGMTYCDDFAVTSFMYDGESFLLYVDTETYITKDVELNNAIWSGSLVLPVDESIPFDVSSTLDHTKYYLFEIEVDGQKYFHIGETLVINGEFIIGCRQ